LIVEHGAYAFQNEVKRLLPSYVEKYRDFITSYFSTPEHFALLYSVALRIRPTAMQRH
jgi:hypothetical protein